MCWCLVRNSSAWDVLGGFIELQQGTGFFVARFVIEQVAMLGLLGQQDVNVLGAVLVNGQRLVLYRCCKLDYKRLVLFGCKDI